MNKLCLLFIFFASGLFAQNDPGFVRFEANETWVIEINDSLIQSGTINELSAGSYKFNARPQISYSWPALFIEDTLQVIPYDTVVFVLSTDKSIVKNKLIQKKPKLTSYPENGYQPPIMKRTKLKSGLLISAIAANWLSFYLKRQADDNYKNYRSASNLSKINNYYDRSKQFDNYSSIMLGISVAALSSYIYISLTE
ncbi:MAG: hypothetical protein D8M58_03360 [Calditrichaeota bacterium]|nr:MAG: hypothetical protein DWQ03_03715 [Calditrichota bacterium]MBL1204404.1 hypothetical protein [Calditrichota bacterium]NOG44233.1 hypothetical protein [Calditrichota bacterium]